jgi:transcriptional regulator with XRE-family HTH domain
MASDPQTAALIEALKKLLKARGSTYRDLARTLGLSEPSIKRLFSQRTFTLQRLEQVCAALEIDFYELAKLARGAAESVEEMSLAQEQALASDSKLLGVFYLVFNQWQPDDILERYVLTRAETLRHVLRLEKLGLVEVLAHDKVRLRVPATLRLRRDGPIRRAHGRSVVTDFIQADFDKSGGLFRFEVRELSKASIALLQRRLERIAREFNELGELDSYLPSDQRETIGMAVGIRPWVVSWAMGLKPRAAAPAHPEPTRRD